ncbi:2-oxoglutarate dehydrogenase E1 component [Novispirillum itersonii]|uniref:2-oxoglutarate dehydrogenase E1 component n=1 Tax=Novispirillum itersonii TaxID=189 RepID=UPI0016079215|nr:2-oxoglutarate dehydrogenase E1 component [Novispirillum itersonii]
MHRTGSVEASFLTGANATFIAELYQRYLDDPASVDPSWVGLFKELMEDPTALAREVKGPSWGRTDRKVIGSVDPDAPPAPKKKPDAAKDAAPAAGGLSEQDVRARVLDSIRVLMMIRTYRVRGHLMAALDPLQIQGPVPHPELDYRTYGFTEADLDREIFIDNVLGLEKARLRDIIALVQKTYCSTIGVEFMHIQDPDQKAWIQKRIEGSRNETEFSVLGKRTILERLCQAEGFEKFLQVKYTGTKRFGLEGGEATIPAIEQILKRGSQLGVEDVVIGMAHRGRLNILTNIMHKPYRAMFSEFQGNSANPDDVQGSGDVKYHLGTSVDREFDGKTVHLSLQPNPSHLETVDPVVLGKVRARQTQIGDTERVRVLGLLIHGDAAFSGQGVVAECFGMSQLKGYRTGGTIHLVINNQIGFTTSPQYSRSGTYCTEIAKMVQAPILHVNGDDPEAVVHAARVAIEYRQAFKADVVLDIVCYRRQGHNESDEPAFTQPTMYKKIGGHTTTRQMYAAKLVQDGLMTAEEAEEVYVAFQRELEKEFEAANSYKPNKADWLESRWKGLTWLSDEEEFREYDTQVSLEDLQKVGKALYTPPQNFDVNRKILRQLKAKEEMFATGKDFDWGTGEALAFGTLVLEGHPVRLSGQDCGRGTFSQRHSVLVDQTTENTYVPLNNVDPKQAHYEVLDSPLSEYGVLGYEFGYSLAEPNGLTLWEAQFGDFANGAQIIFDQYISSSESKWLRMSGLVVLLPHGFEGQGPEHSSARPERYLQLCAEDNMQVCNLTTPANYYHALRRQVRRNFRKPLIIMTPKSLLRHKMAVSELADFGPGSSFKRVIGETAALKPDAQIRRVVLCTGKVYYDLLQARQDKGLDDVALVRVEQLYPWPKNSVKAVLAQYPNADVVWCQEEPANGGYWTFVKLRLDFIIEELGHKSGKALYVGRPASASPATGSYKKHNAEQALLADQALTYAAADLPQPFTRASKLG